MALECLLEECVEISQLTGQGKEHPGGQPLMFQEKDSQIWRKQEVLSLRAAELTEQDLEQLTILIETEAEDFDTFVERSHLTANVMKKRLLADDFVTSFRLTISWICA